MQEHGKTTITKFIVDIYNEAYKIEIGAPTGKAAKRISEVTESKATTIHRMLEIGKYNEEDFDSIFLETKNIYSDIIIIDEASMLDTFMMVYLLRAIKKDAKLILIGDINQLPSVGAGAVLDDIIASNQIKVITLNKIFRQASKSNIILNAHRVNNGEKLELKKGEDILDDLEIFYIENSELMFIELLKRLKIEFENFDIDQFFLNSQILTITKKGRCGTINLNSEIQKHFNLNNKKSIKFGKTEYKLGDRIMQIKNDYEMVWNISDSLGNGIFNGEMGWIKAINLQDKIVAIEFDDGKEALYTYEDLEKITLSYAITVHKSQGSEFDTIILMLPSTVPILLTRNILYTGISRAKKRLVIIGGSDTINKMIATIDTTKRNTNLKNLIIKD